MPKAHSAGSKLANRVSGVFVPVVIASSLLTFIGWYLLEDNIDRVPNSFSAAIAVLSLPVRVHLAWPRPPP